MKPLKENFWIGFLAGSLWLIVILILSFSLPSAKLIQENNDPVVAQIGPEKMTRKELEKRSAQALAPVKSDEYLILKEALDRWIKERLYVLETNRTGKSKAELEKSLWQKVQVSEIEIQKEYKDRYFQFQGIPFSTIHDSLKRELEKRKFDELENDWAESAQLKYQTKILLEKPEIILGNRKMGNLPHQINQPLAFPPAEPLATFDSLEGQPVKGKSEAPVTLIEFSDFQCPFCQRASLTAEKLLENNPDKIKLVWFHFPLNMHPLSAKIHEASECANDQQKFWEFYSLVFSSTSVLQNEEDILKLGKALNLNEEQYQNCVTSGIHREKVARNIQTGTQHGVQSTPTFFLNGKKIVGAQPLESFQAVVDTELKSKTF